MNNSMKTLNNSANMKGLNSFVLKNTQIKPFFINIQVTNIQEYFPVFFVNRPKSAVIFQLKGLFIYEIKW